MTDISNTEYITINKDGIFVGGKPATKYCEEKIDFVNAIKTNFAEIQRQNKNVQELHIGAFETKGKFANSGTPSGVSGRYAWCRVKLFDGRLGNWVYQSAYGSVADCMNGCAHLCSSCVRYSAVMRSAVLDFTKNINTENKQKEKYETISVVEKGFYRITIERIKQR